MNKTTNIAYELAQDIYNLGGNVDRLHEEYDNHHIAEQVYYKKLYVHACEATCLQHVVNVLKSQKYKFARYQKEMLLLESIQEDINNNLNLNEMNSLNMLDMKNLVKSTHKYQEYIGVEDTEKLEDLNI